MTGLVYKELRQNWLLMLAVTIIPALVAFPVCILFLKEMGMEFGDESGKMPIMDIIKNEQSISVWISFLVLAFMTAAMLLGVVFRGDDRKAFAMWTAASPDGVNGYIRIKYELIMVMIMLTLFAIQLGDWTMMLICAAHDAEWFGLAQPMILLSYVQIIIQASEIPCTIRFGVKNGSIIKSIVLVILTLVFLIVYAFNKEAIVPVFEGETEILNTFANYAMALLPVISIVLYYLSYKLSCRLYMKGVEQYDK